MLGMLMTNLPTFREYISTSHVHLLPCLDADDQDGLQHSLTASYVPLGRARSRSSLFIALFFASSSGVGFASMLSSSICAARASASAWDHNPRPAVYINRGLQHPVTADIVCMQSGSDQNRR